MLEKPDLRDEEIITCLQDEYAIRAAGVTFLPRGVDRQAAVYRAVGENSTPYFVKLRRGAFNEVTVELPKFLSDQGIRQIIAPLVTKTGQLWASLNNFKLTLFPFIAGKDGYGVKLTEQNWVDFGKAIKRVHTVAIPPVLLRRIQQETFSPQWREKAKSFLQQVKDDTFNDPVAKKLAAFITTERKIILDLLERAERLGLALQARPVDSIMCHSDIHAGNILISDDGFFYIVDWDNPILAPKERDLMFIGGCQGFSGYSAQEEETLFYQGYGETQIDPIALAYYRYERIIEDIAVFCEQIFLSNEGEEDRKQALRYLQSNFLPNGTIEVAYKTNKV